MCVCIGVYLNFHLWMLRQTRVFCNMKTSFDFWYSSRMAFVCMYWCNNNNFTTIQQYKREWEREIIIFKFVAKIIIRLNCWNTILNIKIYESIYLCNIYVVCFLQSTKHIKKENKSFSVYFQTSTWHPR